MPKRTEADDIVTYLLPALGAVGIQSDRVKIDQTTSKSGRKRGDVWVSRVSKKAKSFEREIVALIEAKGRNATVSSVDWRDAMAQGRDKAAAQGLNFYIVTNCNNTYRYYSVFDDSEIVLDGDVLTRLVDIDVMRKIQASVTATNSFVVHASAMNRVPVSEREFRNTLAQLANVYRSAGLKKGDERIDPSVGFVVLKYICEKETASRTLPNQVPMWDALQAVYDSGGDLGFQFKMMRDMLWGANSQYKDNEYRDFQDLVALPQKLKAEHYRRVYELLNPLALHGASFDLFGCIYEEFASQTKKKEFGEFYTRRHITGEVARLLLREEKRESSLRVCDPACGTGGFLTEAFKAMRDNLKRAGRLNPQTELWLRKDVFWGFDNDERSVARTKLNMFLVGDGHMHVYEQDSITSWENGDWKTGAFQYVITNPPMGSYEGDEDIASFEFTNERRMELLFTERVVKATEHGGGIAIVLNDGALEAPTRQFFREKLLEYCDIRAVISLTRHAFAPYTKEKTYVVFLRRKQAADEGKRQAHPIWHYILDYDGYANSDKRYRTKYHDDLPELSELFPRAMALLDRFEQDPVAFEAERDRCERDVHEQESIEGLTGRKCAFVPIAAVNDACFHNLLSEFHLRPVSRTGKPLKEFAAEVVAIAGELSTTGARLKSGTTVSTVNAGRHKTAPLSAVFSVVGGNSGLTEEVIYENWPTQDDRPVVVFSGSTLDGTAMGHIRDGALLSTGKTIKSFDGPCLIVARKGKAGRIRFVPQGVHFTINDDAYVLSPKPEWKDKIDLRWLASYLEPTAMGLATSKSDNATLSKDYLSRQILELPDIKWQTAAGATLRALDEARERVAELDAKASGMFPSTK